MRPEALADALARARAGDDGPARELVARAGELPSALAVVVARLAMVLREHDRALAILEASPSEIALEWRVGLEARLGRNHAALARAHAAVDASPTERRRTWAARLAGARYDDATALRHLQAVETQWAAREVFRVTGTLGHAERALACTSDGSEKVRIVRAMRLAGHPNEAERALGSLAELPGARAEQSVFAIWRGDFARARALANGDTSSPEARRTLGAVALFDGDPSEALGLLEAIDDEEAHLLRAEALAELGRNDEAERAIACAGDRVDGSSEYLAALALRARVRDEPLVSQTGEEGVEGAARAICPERQGDPRAVLAAMRGNRSPLATTIERDGSFRVVRVQPSSRTLARWAQRKIEHLSPEVTFEGFDPVIAHHPRSPLPFCYRGELHLWLGDLDRAEADFDRAIALRAQTFWAAVGKGAAQLYRGDRERSLATLEEIVRITGRVGPTLFAYRGEARLVSGDLDGAVADLEQARKDRESRIGAWLALGLARAERDEEVEVREIMSHLRVHAWALVADAARELGLPAAIDARAPIAQLRDVFAHALHMSRGNRSSSHRTYFTAEGELRFVSREPFDDDEELDELALVVDRMLGRAPLRHRP